MTTKNEGNGAPPPAAETVQIMRVDEIDPSPTQPRKHFNPDAMAELVESVRAHNIIDPLLVRNRRTPDGPLFARPELVNGERRLRAAKECKLVVVPCIVRAMTDEEVMEVQTIGFLHHQDLHPMEEARAFELLMTKCNFTVEQIAAKTAKSKTHIYQRLRLCQLVPEAEKLFLDGKLDASTAFLVARIPAKLQPKAAEEISGVKSQYDKTPMGYRQAKQHVEQNYMLLLCHAPFDTKSAGLVSEAGACTNCPKRTGFNRDLFGDVPKSDDHCTDPICFRDKKKQHLVNLKLSAKESGRVVMDDAEAKKLWQYGSLKHGSQYQDLDQTCYQDPKRRTYRKLLGGVLKKTPADVILAVDKDGKAHDLLTQDRMAEALKKAGVKVPKEEQATDSASVAEARKRTAEAGAVQEEVNKRFKAAVAKAALTMKAAELYRFILRKLTDGYVCFDDELVMAAQRRFPNEEHCGDLLLDEANKMPAQELLGLLMEIMADVTDAKFFKIDVKAYERAVVKERKAAAAKAESGKREAASEGKPEAAAAKGKAENAKRES